LTDTVLPIPIARPRSPTDRAICVDPLQLAPQCADPDWWRDFRMALAAGSARRAAVRVERGACTPYPAGARSPADSQRGRILMGSTRSAWRRCRRMILGGVAAPLFLSLTSSLPADDVRPP